MAHLAGTDTRRSAGWRVNPQHTATWREALARCRALTAPVKSTSMPWQAAPTMQRFGSAPGRAPSWCDCMSPSPRNLGVDRRREAVLHAAAARAGLASRVLAADPAGRYLVRSSWRERRGEAADIDESAASARRWRRPWQQLHASAGSRGAAAGSGSAPGSPCRQHCEAGCRSRAGAGTTGDHERGISSPGRPMRGAPRASSTATRRIRT